MAKTKIAIEQLAQMINKGFKDTASKEDIHKVEVQPDRVESALGRIESLLMEEQKRKIENLEARMKNSKTPSLSSMAAAIEAAISWRLLSIQPPCSPPHV